MSVLLLNKRRQCLKCLESDTYEFTDPLNGSKTWLCHKCDNAYIRNDIFNQNKNSDENMVRFEFYNNSNPPVDIWFKRMYPKSLYVHATPGWEDHDTIYCKPGKFCNVPNRYYVLHCSDNQRIFKPGELVFNMGDMIGVKNTLPSRPEAKTSKTIFT